MGEFSNYLKERYFKNNKQETKDMMLQQHIKNAIWDMCEQYVDDGEELVFEVLPKDLPYAITVLNEEPIASKYMIFQVSETLFSAKLRELEF